jgi:hypothetical protein
MLILDTYLSKLQRADWTVCAGYLIRAELIGNLALGSRIAPFSRRLDSLGYILRGGE